MSRIPEIDAIDPIGGRPAEPGREAREIEDDVASVHGHLVQPGESRGGGRYQVSAGILKSRSSINDSRPRATPRSFRKRISTAAVGSV